VKIAWLFPGQGSQEVGMGKSVHETSAAARSVYDRADAALGDLASGGALSTLCFAGPLEALTLTENTQPALVATSSALVAAIREALPSLPAPVVALGHSLGEYSALVAAGALSLEDAVRLVRARGRAMQEAVPPGEGSMAAVLGMDPDAIRAVCRDAASAGLVSPANFNAPGQIVIAGAKPAVDQAAKLVAERGGKAIPLKVSAPFHCALMKPAAERLAAAFETVKVSPLAFPVIANVDAEGNLDPSRVKELCVRQVDAPVEWVRSIERAAAMGVTIALEIGPGKVLAGLVKRIDKRIRVINVSDAAAIASLEGELSKSA
jgi:[acyl-carrier-protein] S-malonyltransferase